MIFLPRFKHRPPQGRIDGIIYYGAVPDVSTYAFYYVDLSNGAVGYLPEADLPAGAPSGPAGGALNGSYPNPGIASVPDAALTANVPVMTAGVLPAVDGSQLTNLPTVPTLDSGIALLDSGGTVTITVPSGAVAVVATYLDMAGSGILFVQNVDLTTWTITSAAGATDAAFNVAWICL